MKKFFSFLAAAAFVFTAVACNGNSTDFGQIGTISGGDVTYDAATGKISKELTINLDGAKVTSDIADKADMSTYLGIIGPSITDADDENPSITAVDDIEADATSFTVKIEGFVASIEGLDGKAAGVTEAYNGSFAFIPDTTSAFTITNNSKILFIGGGKFSELRQTAYAEAEGSSTTVTVTLTGATYTTNLATSDLKLVSVTADGKETEVTISAVDKKTSKATFTITTSDTVTSGTTYKLTISNPSSHFTADKDTTDTSKDAYVVPTGTLTATFDVT